MKSILFFCSFCLIACGCMQESAQELAILAEKHFTKGEYSKAIRTFEKVNTCYGETAATWHNIALTAFYAQDYTHAKYSVEQALRLLKDAPDAKEQKEVLTELQALIAEMAGAKDEAMTLYYTLLGTENIDLRIRVKSRIAKIYFENKCNDGALAFLLSASNDRTMDPTTCFNLGKLCMDESLNLRRESLDYFSLAERLLPDNSNQKKEARSWMTRLEKNLERLRQVPANEGNETLCERARKKYKEATARNRWSTAESHAKEAVAANPANIDAVLELAFITEKNKHFDDAIKAYESAIILRPTHNETRRKAAALAYKQKLYKKGADFLRPALPAQPRQTAAIDQMMRLLYSQQKLVDARAWGEYYLTLVNKDNENYKSYRKFVDTLPIKPTTLR